MTEINIPGDELQAASSNMQQVLQLFGNTNTSALDMTDALGASDTLVTGAAQNFNSRWTTGQSQIQSDGQTIIDAINQIISTFTDTDNNLADSLTPGSAGRSPSSSATRFAHAPCGCRRSSGCRRFGRCFPPARRGQSEPAGATR